LHEPAPARTLDRSKGGIESRLELFEAAKLGLNSIAERTGRGLTACSRSGSQIFPED
jgi:hypothetical protein